MYQNMQTYEIEIKSLLGEKEYADMLLEKMHQFDPDCRRVSQNSQLNHYFEGGDIQDLYQAVHHLFADEKLQRLQTIAKQGTSFSIRTRQKDDEVLLVVKASLDGGTSENTVSRLEFEEIVDVSLAELDELVLSAGYQYQAKWSRERQEYTYKDINVCIDKNAGYGYLAEFETVTEDEKTAAEAKEKLKAMMDELGVKELDQDRLARMFEYYNTNWADYYGTNRTFVIE